VKVVVVVAGTAIDPPYGIESQSQRVAAEALVDCGTGTAGVIMRGVSRPVVLTGQSARLAIADAHRAALTGVSIVPLIRDNKSRCLMVVVQFEFPQGLWGRGAA
jgi:hypothetical protein